MGQEPRLANDADVIYHHSYVLGTTWVYSLSAEHPSRCRCGCEQSRTVSFNIDPGQVSRNHHRGLTIPHGLGPPWSTMEIGEHAATLQASLAKANLVPGAASTLIAGEFVPIATLDVSFDSK